jgi:hypothetical protein
MFWTAEVLKCTGCCESYSLPVRDIFVYSLGSVDLSPENLSKPGLFPGILRARAWCFRCAKPVLAERIPSTREFMNAVAILRSGTAKKSGIDDEMLERSVEELQVLFEKLKYRKSPGRCLSCGTTEWSGFEVVNGKIVPELVHDEPCNSSFEWNGFIAGVIGRLKVRAYSFEGELLAEGEVVG